MRGLTWRFQRFIQLIIVDQCIYQSMFKLKREHEGKNAADRLVEAKAGELMHGLNIEGHADESGYEEHRAQRGCILLNITRALMYVTVRLLYILYKKILYVSNFCFFLTKHCIDVNADILCIYIHKLYP